MIEKKSSLTMDEFKAFLQALADSDAVRIVGSYAKGTQNSGGYVSDLDLFILGGDRGMKKVIEIYNAHGIEWHSVVVGSIGSPRNADYMPIPVECSYLFDCKTRRTFHLTICGVKFKAYEQ